MPTFIDESGDTGPTKDGGKPYFRLAAVWVPTLEAAEEFREKIRALRRDLDLQATYEFKFAQTHREPLRRAAFYAAALTQDFRFAVSSIDKTDAYWSRAGSHEQHWACATDLAALLRATYFRAEDVRATPFKEPVVVDDDSDRAFLAAIKRQFRGLMSGNRVGTPLVGKVTFRDSAADEMLQLVDMICGAVGAMIDSKERIWYDLIGERDLAPKRFE